MLDDICEKIGGVKKKELHAALKRGAGITTLTDLSKRELYDYMLNIEAHFASEYGIEVLGNEDETLSEILN